MTNTLFALTFPLAVPFWAMMILLPHWRWTSRIIASPLIVVPPLVIYLLVMIPMFPQFWRAVSAPDLAVLQDVLASPSGAAAVWAQLIAFDLFIGRWMFRDARARGISPYLMGPLLVLTILLSPIGVLTYLALRQIPLLQRAAPFDSSRSNVAAALHPVVD
jgi:Domain of unknown function (DUF4281)